MTTIKAQDLKPGTYVKDWGDVEEVIINGDFVEVTFSNLDLGCGEIEFYPVEVPLNETFEI